MLSDLFTFEGRLGRLAYLGRSLMAIVAQFVPCAILVALAFLSGASGLMLLAIAVLVCCSLANFWVMLALQARRFRDIGWNPAVAIGCVFLFFIVDTTVAHLVPAFAVQRYHNHTVFGLVGQIALVLILLIMPGADDDTVLPERRGVDRGPTGGDFVPSLPGRLNNGQPRRLFGKA